MATANPASSDLLILVIVLGCVVGILVLALTVTCACLCRHQMHANKKTRAAKGQNKKKSMTEAKTVNGQNVGDSRPNETIDDGKVKSSLAFFYHKPDAETQQIVTRVQINDNNYYNPNRFTASAANGDWSAGYQPTLPWPRIALSGTAATSNYGRWNPAQDGRVVLNATPWSVQQGSSVVPVSVYGGDQSSGFRSTQAERVVLNAVDECNGKEGARQATVLYPVLS